MMGLSANYENERRQPKSLVCGGLWLCGEVVVGTIITMPSNGWPSMGIDGGKSTSPIGPSASWKSSVWLERDLTKVPSHQKPE